MNFLISGCAGFIGYHLSNYLCKKYKNSKIIGFDNLNNYYSIKLKKKGYLILRKIEIFILVKLT